MTRLRIVQVGVALVVGALAWLVAFAPERNLEVLSETDTDYAFSLDFDVVGSTEHPIIYAVEQRARPNYRIFSLEPSTGEIETIFEVPTDAIVFDINLSPDGNTLAVAYSTDYTIPGSGLSLLDLSSNELTEVTPATDGSYLTDLAWNVDGTEVLATHVDRSGPVGEVLSIVGVDLDGVTTEYLDTGISPIDTADGLYYLTLDEDNARRSIGLIDNDGETHLLEIEDGEADLDHLTADTTATQVAVAVIEAAETGLTLGETADAHGNHDVPSAWATVDSADSVELLDQLGETIVYDAAATPDSIVYATREGISIATDERVDLITSRAIRLIAG